MILPPVGMWPFRIPQLLASQMPKRLLLRLIAPSSAWVSTVTIDVFDNLHALLQRLLQAFFFWLARCPRDRRLVHATSLPCASGIVLLCQRHPHPGCSWATPLPC